MSTDNNRTPLEKSERHKKQQHENSIAGNWFPTKTDEVPEDMTKSTFGRLLIYRRDKV